MLSADIAEGLRARGRDVIAVDEHGELRGLSDEEQFEFAQAEQCAVATYNRDDYLELDRYYRQVGREHAGLVTLNAHRFRKAARPSGRSSLRSTRSLPPGLPIRASCTGSSRGTPSRARGWNTKFLPWQGGRTFPRRPLYGAWTTDGRPS